jgi:hypothetical protein
VVLRAHVVRLGEPGPDIGVDLRRRPEPEAVHVVAGADGLHPGESGVVQGTGEDDVPVEPVPSRREGANSGSISCRPHAWDCERLAKSRPQSGQAHKGGSAPASPVIAPG